MADILRSRPGGSQTGEKNWLKTVGTWRDDAFSREANHLGEAWRQSVKDSI